MFQYWVVESMDGETWRTAYHPDFGNITYPFNKLASAEHWIASMPDVYAKLNKRMPPKYQREMPRYKILVRDVTEWRELRADDGGENNEQGEMV